MVARILPREFVTFRLRDAAYWLKATHTYVLGQTAWPDAFALTPHHLPKNTPMSAVAEAPTLSINATLLDSVVGSMGKALTMCEMTARCVGASQVPNKESGLVTGMIGVHGDVSGFVTVNMSERFACRAVGKLMQDDFGTELNSTVVDGCGELTNMIVGGIKSALSTSEWAFSQITVPSVIVGKGYSIAYARGLEFLTVSFESEDAEAVLLEDRMIYVSMSLLRR